MSRVWVIWLVFCGLSLGNASNSARSDLLMSSISDAVRNGATIVSRFLNPKTSTFLPFVFQKLSERMKKFEKTSGGKSEGEEDELTLIMLKLMGVDAKKLSDFAFNGVFSLLTQMQDPNLMDLILKESQMTLKSNPEKDVECISLLLCRTKPFVRGMQRSLKFFLKREKVEISDGKVFEERGYEETAWETADLEDRMYFFAPSMKEVVESGALCDQLFPNCHY